MRASSRLVTKAQQINLSSLRGRIIHSVLDPLFNLSMNPLGLVLRVPEEQVCSNVIKRAIGSRVQCIIAGEGQPCSYISELRCITFSGSNADARSQSRALVSCGRATPMQRKLSVPNHVDWEFFACCDLHSSAPTAKGHYDV